MMWRRRAFDACLSLTVLLLPAIAAASADRLALVVGANFGLDNEPPLRWAARDAQRLAALLVDLGDVPAENVVVLTDPDAAAMLRAVHLLRERSPAELLQVYFSGHADAGSLHLSGSRLPMATLLDALGDPHGALQLVVIDACQSGGVNRAKGSRPGPPIDVGIGEARARGRIVIASSAVGEAAYESDTLQGALFSTHWISGLRGAADRDGDGHVTLGEAYRHAYAHTLGETLLSAGGPQHASFAWKLDGRQEPVLTRLHHDARLTLDSSSDGTYVVFTPGEADVVAEVPLSAGTRATLALGRGTYLIKKHDTAGLRAVAVELTEGDDRLLYDRHMAAVPRIRLAQKGVEGELWVSAAVGQLATGLGPRGAPMASLAADLVREDIAYGTQLTFTVGNEVHRDLTTDSLGGGLTAHALWLWSPAQRLTLASGPAVGVYLWRQQPAGRPASRAPVVLAAAHLGTALRISERLGIGVQLEAGYLAARARGALPAAAVQMGEFVALPWGSYLVQGRVAF